MNILQAREPIKDGLEFLTEGLLRVLDLPGIEACAKDSISNVALSITR